MHLAIYFNVLICVAMAVMSMFTSFYIYQKNKKSYIDLSVSLFWFSASIVWLFFGISMLMVKLGAVDSALLLNQYFVQTAGTMQIVLISYYILSRLFNKNKIIYFFQLIILIISLAALYYNYLPGTVKLTKYTNFSFEYSIHENTLFLLSINLVIVGTVIFINFLKSTYYWLKGSNKFDEQHFIIIFSIIIYSIISYMEEAGLYSTWVSELFRIALLMCPYITYIAYKDKINE